MPGSPLRFLDDDGEAVELTGAEADALWRLTDGFDAATVSACPRCRSRIVAVVALADLLDAAPPHPRAEDLIELADDAPTLHLYVDDVASGCDHRDWLDPGFEEWDDVVHPVEHPLRRPAP